MSIVLLVVLVLLVIGALVGTAAAIRSDGYGPRPDRADLTVPERRRF